MPHCNAANLPAYRAVRSDSLSKAALSANLVQGNDGMKKRRFLVFLLILALATPGAALAEAVFVVPGGQSIGVAVATNGLVVIGNSDLGSIPSPARMAGLRAGDVLISADGEPLTSAQHLLYLIEEKSSVTLAVQRGGEQFALEISPVKDPRDGVSRLGVWVRDSAVGVGTLSFYDPETLRYGALGHAITDIDTGTILSIDEGLLFDSCVVDIQRGASGAPGELIGQFSLQEEAVGSICKNTEFGIFGSLDAPAAEGFTGAIPLAEPNEVKSGKAQLYTTLDGEGVRAYDCEITRVTAQNAPATRSMTIRITDKQLIEKTGGNAQGMSGSPIIQNGKLVGVVTHVYVGDPQQGYAVYAKWMYDEMAA